MIKFSQKRLKFFVKKFLAKGLLIFAKNYSGEADSEKILIIAPHPDDEIFGLGGYLLGAKESGCRIFILYLTDGESSDVYPDKEEIRRSRILLSEKVCDKLMISISDIFRLHLIDGSIPGEEDCDYQLAVESVVAIIDSIRPGVVFCTHPLDYWPADHVAASQITKEAILSSQSKPQLWFYWVWAWFNFTPVNLFKYKIKNLYKINTVDYFKSKEDLINLYLNSFTPDGQPWSGKLPKEFLNSVRNNVEIIELFSS